MKAGKLILIWVIVTIVMIISWAIGTICGNIITNAAPPTQPSDPATAGLIFIGVCAFNAILVTALASVTSNKVVLISFLFAVQFLLPQMDTYFFGSAMGIGYDQVTSIVISGLIVSIITMLIASWLYKKFFSALPGNVSFRIQPSLALLLVFIGYPLLYLLFGRFIAWQSETLRVYYSSSPEMIPFADQLADIFLNGLYFFQILRAAIWLGVTIPIAHALQEKPATQFLLVGVLSSLLPASLLLIPNPYMPREVAMVHLVEISISNFLWGILIVWGVRRSVATK